MNKNTVLIVAGVVGAFLLFRTYGQRLGLTSSVNQAAGPRLPGLPSLPSLPSLPAVSGAVPNMPSMPKMPSMPWMNGGQMP